MMHTIHIGKKNSYSLAALLAIACAMLGLAGCGSSPPKPDKARMTLVATGDVNPAADGRPSPVVVRIYQLKEDAKFNNADFFALFDNDQQALGGDLLAREEFELTPGERRETQFLVVGGAKYLAAMAAYRDVRNAKWRDVRAAPKKGLLDLVKKDAITVTLGRAAVTVEIRD